MYFRIRHLLIFFILAVIGFVVWQGTKNVRTAREDNGSLSKAELGAPLFNYFGNYHKPITTTSALAQRYFTQGLILYYGLNFEESVRAFKEVTRLDPHCAMGYWGLALALGANASAPFTGKERREAMEAMQKAEKFAPESSEADQAYIKALAKRYQNKYDAKVFALFQEKDDSDACKGMCRRRAVVTLEESRDYSNAMKEVADAFPRDVDAKNLYAASLMDTADWNFYNKEQEPSEDALEIIAALEGVLKLDPKNLPAHHYYIHVIAPSSNPEQGLRSADYLRGLRPALHQFASMPAHIYILTGRYHDATVANQRAIVAYKDYISESWAQGFEPKKNDLLLHDLHSLYTSAVFQGRSHLALETAEELARQAPHFLAKGKDSEWFSLLPYFARMQFGFWKEILDEPKPEKPFQIAMWHYGRGIAFFKLGQVDEAENELKVLKRHLTAISLSPAKMLQLQIALAVLEAEMYEKLKNYPEMLKAWEKAIQIEEAARERGPSLFWIFPLREGLADAFLKMQQPKKAEEEYKRVLKQYPENGWSLYGLSKSLFAQDRPQDAQEIQERFKRAWARSDISLPLP